MFAKLFGPPEDQIVMMLREGDDGPEVRLYFQPDSPVLNVCETAFGYTNKKDAQKLFDEMTEERVRDAIAPLKEKITQFFS